MFVLLLAALAAAPPPTVPRVAVILADADGDPSLAEDVLMKTLLDSGAVAVIDEGQRRQLRGLTDPAALLRGEVVVPPGLTGFDVDWLVLGRARYERIGGQVLGDKLVRIDLALDLRIIEADTGQIRQVLRGNGQGLAISANSARRQAAERAVAQLLGPVVQATQSDSPLALVLIVEGLPDANAAESLRARMEAALPERPIHFDGMERGRARFRIEGEGLVASDLGASLATVGLAIDSISRGTLTGHLDVAPRWAKAEVGSPGSKRVALEPKLPPLFLAQAETYARHGISGVEIHNLGPNALIGAVLMVEGPGLLAGPQRIPVPKLGPRAHTSLPLPLVIAPARIGAQRGRASVALELSLHSAAGAMLEARSVTVVVHDRSTVDWSDPESVAAFVTPSPPLQRLADEALDEVPAHDPLLAFASLWGALRAQGLRYRADAVTASGLDQVARPLETWSKGQGDCEDLSVLVAALAESAGIPALLLVAPGHTLVALGTQVPAQGGLTLGPDPGMRLLHQGRWYIPLEATAIEEGFVAAWTEGARGLARVGSARPIALAEAWRLHPPLELPLPEPTAKVTAPSVAAERSALSTARQEAFRVALAAAEGPLLRARLQLFAGHAVEAAQALEDPALSTSMAALNDRANLALVQGDVTAARRGYAQARTKAGREVPAELLANQGLAARLDGDRADFGRVTVELLERGEEQLVRALAEAQGGPGPAIKGSGPSSGPPPAWLVFWLGH